MVSKYERPKKARSRNSSSTCRAAKLRAEAANCIALALDLAPDPFCVDLLEEAALLSGRAARMGEPEG